MSEEVLGGRYRLIRVLGEGGMARVHEAEDLRLGRRVAVKILHSQFTQDADFLRRFEQEARLAASLSHPNVVGVFDVGQDSGSYFIVMELVDGQTLKDLIRATAPLAVPEAVRIALEVCAALSAAHARGLIHRDIKPQNVLLTREGQVKVADFGIARRTSSTTVTQTGTVLGSVHYLSPEQARGQEAGPRADLYSLGVTLFEMLTGRLPFDAENPIAVAMQHVQNAPPLPRQFNRSIPPALEGVILRLLAKNPAERYPDANAAAEAMRNVLNQASGQTRVARPAPPPTAIGPVLAASQTRLMPSQPLIPPLTRAPAIAAPLPTQAEHKGRRSILVGSALGGIVALGVIIALAIIGSGGSSPFAGANSNDSPTRFPSVTPTSSPTHVPTPLVTHTPVGGKIHVGPTITPTGFPAKTPLPGALATATASARFTPTDTPVPATSTPVDTATQTPTPSDTFTALPTFTPSPVDTDTPVPTDTSTPSAIPTETVTRVPTATAVPPTSIPSTATPTEIPPTIAPPTQAPPTAVPPTEAPTTVVPTSVPTVLAPTETPTALPTAIPTEAIPTAEPTQLPGGTPIVTETPPGVTTPSATATFVG